MSRRQTTIEPGYFNALYRADGDPWRFRTSAYEADKYAATLAALRQPRYPAALEVGCSIGVFTAMLAPRCDALLAVDASEAALAIAVRDGAPPPNTTFARCLVPAEFPSGAFDLIVLSEVLYYLQQDDLERMAVACERAQQSGGQDIVMCHWLGETDYPMTGLEATERFAALMTSQGYTHAILHAETYRLDRLTRNHDPVERRA